jgi:DNA-binding transcriptional ArsR family regulator
MYLAFMTETPPPQEIVDVEALKLLAHPLRQRIEQQLRQGPVTSTTLAKALGVSTGLASYHLRELAKHGFVEEVPELSQGKKRWWRFVPKDRRFPPHSEQNPEMRALIEQMRRLDLAADLDQLARFQLQRERDELGQWSDGLLVSRSPIRLTFDELREFFEDYIKLLYRYKRADEDTPAGARTVLTSLLAFPEPTDPEHPTEPERPGGGE